MRTFFYLNVFLLVQGVLCCLPCLAVEAPRNPNSAKECAICHYRWIDTFFIDGRGSDLVPYQKEKVVAKPEICFSCHDGSVVDSRAKVYNDHRHPINKPPPATMKIPAVFPLDEQGNMQCATCHTAHGVPSEMGMEKTIFLRVSNRDSAMCRMCHKDKDGGPAKGNHPIDSTKLPISPKLLRQGADEGSAKNQVICQTCHAVHGSLHEKFLTETAKDSALCLACHKEKASLLGTGHDLSRSAPAATNSRGQTPAESGLCGACHLVHGGRKVALWAREIMMKSGNPAQDLCLGCHREQGLAKKKLLTGFSHPVNIALREKGVPTTLPTYGPLGRRAATKNSLMTCLTCHDPHQGRKESKTAQRPVVGRARPDFLRLENGPSSSLCKDCHGDKALVENSDHDLRLTGAAVKNSKGQLPAESGVCGVCHRMHGAPNRVLWARNLPDMGAQALCSGCHAAGGAAPEKMVNRRSHPLGLAPARLGLHTTLPLYDRQGEIDPNGVMTCSTCHDPHQWEPKQKKPEKSAGREGDARNSFLRLAAAPSPVLCGNCHAAKIFVEKTDHDLRVTAPRAKNIQGRTAAESGVCGACHLVHNGPNEIGLWARDFGPGNGVMDRMCTDCHARGGIGGKKVPKVASHPEGKLITNVGRNVKGKPNYFPIFHKQTGKPVTVGDIACPSCHEVHQWDPKRARKGTGLNREGRATNSFLRMQTYSLMCIDCHGLDALFRFKYYHNSKKRGPVVRR